MPPKSGSTRARSSPAESRSTDPVIKDRAERIAETLDSLYPEPPCPLDHVDAFTLLVAVVLSAQTTDGKVNEATKELFGRAPTPELMSKFTPEEVRLPQRFPGPYAWWLEGNFKKIA